MKQLKMRKQRQSRSISGVCAELVEQRLLMSTYVVNSTADTLSPQPGQVTLRSAIATANANPGIDTINFSPSVFPTSGHQTITLINGELPITNYLNVNGPGKSALTIDANQKSRVFNITSPGFVNISSMTLINGWSAVADSAGNTYGGAIVSSTNLNLYSVNILNSHVQATGYSVDFGAGDAIPGDAKGGAIYATGNLALFDCSFVSNSAKNDAQYDAFDDGSLPIPGGAYGGAVYVSNSFGAVDCTFSNNLAQGIGSLLIAGPAAGGAIYSTSGEAGISRSTFVNNFAYGGNGESNGDGGDAAGGAVYASQGGSIDQSTFDGNQAIAGESGQANGFSGVARGGGFFGKGASSFVFMNSTLTNNKAVGGDIGSEGVSNPSEYLPSAGGGYAGDATVAFTNSTISNNLVSGGGDAGSQGGGVSANQVSLDTTTVSNNTAIALIDPILSYTGRRVGGPVYGGGVYARSGGVQIARSTISGNFAHGGDGFNFNEDSVPTAGGDAFGGGVYVLGETYVDNSTIVNNTVKGGQGGNGWPNTDFQVKGENGGNATGGGIYATGVIDYLRSDTILGNSVVAGQGGTAAVGNGSNGTATEPGVDVQPSSSAGTTQLVNSIVQSYTGTFTTIQSNFVGGNPQLSALDYHGGTTQTMVPLPGSPVINAGNNLDAQFFPVDQIGNTRVINGTVDIGAVEVNPVLSGSTFGTAGSYKNNGNTFAKAFDGNLSTYFDGATPDGNVVGVDFGTPTQIASISFAPRPGYSGRMLDGIFQGSNSIDFSNPQTLYEVNQAPAVNQLTTIAVNNATAYRYYRYVSRPGTYGNIAELKFNTVPVGQLVGTPIGTPGSYNFGSLDIGKVFDGDLSTYFDASVMSGAWVGVDLGTPKIVNKISYAPRSGFASRMVGGVFQASNSADFSSGVVTLYSITSTPPSGVLTTQTISNSSAYRYYRCLGPAGAYCNVAELKFFGSAVTATKLTGTTIGTGGSFFNDGNTIAKAVDGDLSTFYNAATASGGWVGIDLGTAKVVTQVRYAPRSGFESRVVGGQIQASNTANFSTGVVTLLTIGTAPASGSLTTQAVTNSTAYRYYRYLSPNGAYGNIAEIEFDG